MKMKKGYLTTDRKIYKYQFLDLDIGDSVDTISEQVNKNSSITEKYVVTRANHWLYVEKQREQFFTEKEVAWLNCIVPHCIEKEDENFLFLEDIDDEEDASDFVSSFTEDELDLFDFGEEDIFRSKEEEKQFDRLIIRLTDSLHTLSCAQEEFKEEFAIEEETLILYRTEDTYCLENEDGELILSLNETEDILEEFKKYFLGNKNLYL